MKGETADDVPSRGTAQPDGETDESNVPATDRQTERRKSRQRGKAQASQPSKQASKLTCAGAYSAFWLVLGEEELAQARSSFGLCVCVSACVSACVRETLSCACVWFNCSIHTEIWFEYSFELSHRCSRCVQHRNATEHAPPLPSRRASQAGLTPDSRLFETAFEWSNRASLLSRSH